MITDRKMWLGSDDSFLDYLAIEERIRETPQVDLARMSADIMTGMHDEDDDEFDGSGYMVSRIDNLALVSVSGPLVTTNRSYNRFYGEVSYDEIRNAVYAAATHPEIDGIVMYMRTPGGAASGIADTGNFLKKVDQNIKPVYTFTDTIMASGGYWLGSFGREIYASELATVGSIGVITVHMSIADMLKKQGIEATVIRKGEFKALGSSYEKLDAKALAQIDGQMETIYDVFLKTVSENRGTAVPALKETAAEGRVFLGEEALTVGLVDHVEYFDEAINAISKKLSSSSGLSVTHPVKSTIGVDAMKKRVLTEAGIAAIQAGAVEADVLKLEGMTREATDSEADVEMNEFGKPVRNAEGIEIKYDDKGNEVTADAPADTPAPNTKETPTPAGHDMALIDKIGTLQVEVAQLKADLGASKAEATGMSVNLAALTKITVTQTARMQVALGGVPLKLEDCTSDVAIESYNKVVGTFNTRFRPGGKAAVINTEDDEGIKDTTPTVLGTAARKLTQQKS